MSDSIIIGGDLVINCLKVGNVKPITKIVEGLTGEETLISSFVDSSGDLVLTFDRPVKQPTVTRLNRLFPNDILEQL